MIKGSHDSAAYALNLSVSFWGSGKWENLRKSGNMLSFVKSRIKNMTLTQDKSIKDQLNSGVRAFDIRLAYANNKIYCCHTFATVLFSEFTSQVNNFFNGTPNEKIYVLIRPDYDSGTTLRGKETELFNFIQSEFGTRLVNQIKCYYKPLSDLLLPQTIHNMNELHIVWFDSQTAQDFIAKYKNYTINPAKDVINGALTPSTSASFDNLFCISLKKYAASLNPLLPGLIASKEDSPLILLTDFV